MTTPRIDWWRVITDLERAGISHERVAAECVRSKAWVANIKNCPNAEPRFHDGMILLRIWQQWVGDITQASRPVVIGPNGQEPVPM